VAGLALGLTLAASTASPAAAGLDVHARGNHLVDARGRVVRLYGVARSGAEYACASRDRGGYGYGIFDGPVGTQSITAMRRWHINAVQLPLNEDCWLGINGIRAVRGSATAVRSARTCGASTGRACT
jgi:hypothetical protein